MGPGFFDAIASAMAWLFVACLAAAFALGALAVWGLPKLWEMLKPWVHAITA